jgi:PIN domain nuclease of toxin-antitoxin system
VILLLDAHVALWALGEPERLPPPVRESLANPANDVLVSVGSVWEIEIKRALGKLTTEADLVAALAAARIDLVPITAVDAVTAARLPAHHRDPFDRMLVAQAARLDATIVSRDAVFDRYGAARLPA